MLQWRVNTVPFHRQCRRGLPVSSSRADVSARSSANTTNLLCPSITFFCAQDVICFAQLEFAHRSYRHVILGSLVAWGATACHAIVSTSSVIKIRHASHVIDVCRNHLGIVRSECRRRRRGCSATYGNYQLQKSDVCRFSMAGLGSPCVIICYDISMMHSSIPNLPFNLWPKAESCSKREYWSCRGRSWEVGDITVDINAHQQCLSYH